MSGEYAGHFTRIGELIRMHAYSSDGNIRSAINLRVEPHRFASLVHTSHAPGRTGSCLEERR